MAWNDPPSFDYQQLANSGKKFKHRYVLSNSKIGQATQFQQSYEQQALPAQAQQAAAVVSNLHQQQQDYFHQHQQPTYHTNHLNSNDTSSSHLNGLSNSNNLVFDNNRMSNGSSTASQPAQLLSQQLSAPPALPLQSQMPSFQPQQQ